MARKTKEEALTPRAHSIDAARRVFHAEGVNRSTLDKVAQAAGVTRGAVYWHFANKTELFLAVKQTYMCEFDRLQSLLDEEEAPLDAMTRYLQALFAVLLENQTARETFEIILLRCEYVEEFHEVLQVITQPCTNILSAYERLYRAAAANQHQARAGPGSPGIGHDGIRHRHHTGDSIWTTDRSIPGKNRTTGSGAHGATPRLIFAKPIKKRRRGFNCDVFCD